MVNVVIFNAWNLIICCKALIVNDLNYYILSLKALTYCLEVRNHMVSDNENVKKDELERLQQLIPLLRTNQDYNNNN